MATGGSMDALVFLWGKETASELECEQKCKFEN